MSKTSYSSLSEKLRKTEKALNIAIKGLSSAGTVSSEAREALEGVIKCLDAPSERRSLVDAQLLAESFKTSFVPFTFKDIGLRWNQGARKKFLIWAEQNQLYTARERCAGANGYQFVFYPYKWHSGVRIIAPASKRGRGPVKRK